MFMNYPGRKQTTNAVLMLEIFIGSCAGFVTAPIATLGAARFV
jgi:hypothetical protein